MRIRWTDELDAKVIRMRAENMPIDEIAKAMGVTRQTIAGRLNKLAARGTYEPEFYNKWTTRMEEEFIAFRRRGWSLARIADKLGITEGAAAARSSILLKQGRVERIRGN